VCPEAVDNSRLSVFDGWTAQAEEILAAKPDLVLASVPYQLEAVRETLKAGTRFLALALIAGIMGVPDRGERVVSGMQAAIEKMRVLCATDGPKPSVFCEEWGKPFLLRRWRKLNQTSSSQAGAGLAIAFHSTGSSNNAAGRTSEPCDIDNCSALATNCSTHRLQA
jgi:ABC-type Fe3+-hydroxamate transport system substrate-binding protein